jgi:hypothetical protein
MFRFLAVAAAVAVGVWAVLRRARSQPAAGPFRTSTTIVIGGTAAAPAITRLPERLVARRGDELVWNVRNDTGATQEISLRGFTGAGDPAAQPPLEKTDADRRLHAGPAGAIRDRVRANAAAGTYKYDIWLNGQLAVDPEVVIYEGA